MPLQSTLTLQTRSTKKLILGILTLAFTSSVVAAGTPTTTSDAIRLLDQAAFGPSDTAIAAVVATGAAGWIDQQLAMPATGYAHYNYIDSKTTVGCPTGSDKYCLRENYSAFPIQLQFYRNAVSGPDQLRQRVALAWSQIFVVSGLEIKPVYAMREYEQMLLDNAFGNFRDLLQRVTLSPAMGDYLDLVRNDKPNPATGLQANENYARELMQLFTIGLVTLNPDGTPFKDARGATVPTFDLPAVQGLARALTGWTFAPKPGTASVWANPAYYFGAMVPFADHHDADAKTIVGNRTLPAGQTPEKDMADALDALFRHPNVGPFIGRQLIQFLVTSNPTPAYVTRVTAVFNNNGNGVRGDMKAVVRAILLDPEARGDSKSDPNYGKLREPAVWVASVARAFGGRTDGVFLHNAANTMGQSVFNADSVFNFYSPDDALPNSATLVAPQFGISTASSILARYNTANREVLINTGVTPDPNVAGSTGTFTDFTGYTALAATPSLLVDRMDALLNHATMSSTEKNAIVAAINGIPAWNTGARARTAAYLIVTSPTYQITR